MKEKLKQAQPGFCGESPLKFIFSGMHFPSNVTILSGKIMEDDKTLDFYNVTENGFIVVMVQVVKPPKDSVPEPIKKVERFLYIIIAQ